MVGKILGFLYKESPTLHRAAYLLGFFALLSQILAFLRDRLLAHIFGAGAELDLYYAAFRIPDLIFVTVASVVSVSVLVPFIVDRDKTGKESVARFLDSIFTFFSLLIVVVCGAVFFFVPQISETVFRGFGPEELDQVIKLSRILLLSPIFLGFSNLFGSITQSYNRFAVYALAPLLYNIGIISGTVLFAEDIGVMGVVFGVVSGSLLHMLVQIPFVIKSGLLPHWTSRLNLPAVYDVVRLSLPRTLTLSFTNIASLFLVALASSMAVGSVSVFSFSQNIQSAPLSLIGVSYSLAAFPTLVKHFSGNNIKAFMDQMVTTARHIIFWSLPFAALFIVLRAQIVRVLLGSGNFTWTDTRLTAAALALFSVSAVFQGLNLLFVRAFYSAGRTKEPLIINLISTLALIAGTYGLVLFFSASPVLESFFASLLRVEDISGIGVLMLPLGFSLGSILNTILLWLWFERDFGGFSRSVARTFFQALSASVIVGYVSYWGLQLLAPLLRTESLVGIFWQGMGAGFIGVVAGVVLLKILKSRELSEAWETLHSRFWKEKVIASDPEIV